LNLAYGANRIKNAFKGQVVNPILHGHRGLLPSQSAIVYTGPEKSTAIGPEGVLDGGDVLPGFELSLRQLFSEENA
jgi:hypothetical protein